MKTLALTGLLAFSLAFSHCQESRAATVYGEAFLSSRHGDTAPYTSEANHNGIGLGLRTNGPIYLQAAVLVGEHFQSPLLGVGYTKGKFAVTLGKGTLREKATYQFAAPDGTASHADTSTFDFVEASYSNFFVRYLCYTPRHTFVSGHGEVIQNKHELPRYVWVPVSTSIADDRNLLQVGYRIQF